ncbi:hypothetical protein RFI_38082 [Reticulomyxa filosa]|uniref:Uncharacterized protein n=1 Tax=Reticulomyxa filosa TaxID=46433 RepID=X6LDI4_RETFI|nr:hypothetical protein RFI_38082 [Reticulomyxa filosa]|eukprot:ETN99400.1 hypothetical protein RFI_38082 [Reticulomyxa filosa]
MSQSKHHLKYIQEYLRMAREVMIDKEHLDYLDHHKMFYMCDMTDNFQYWMIVEKESFVVCCENGGLPSHNFIVSSVFQTYISQHRINLLGYCQVNNGSYNSQHRGFFELKKKSSATISEGTLWSFFHGHDFLSTDYSSRDNKHSKFAFDFEGSITAKTLALRMKGKTDILKKFGTVSFFPKKKGNIF